MDAIRKIKARDIARRFMSLLRKKINPQITQITQIFSRKDVQGQCSKESLRNLRNPDDPKKMGSRNLQEPEIALAK